MNKAELRKKYKALRLELSEDKIEALSLEIANKLLQLPVWQKEFYHLFLSIAEQKEIDTENILHILQGKDKNVVLSKTNIKEHKLEHFLLTDSSVIKKNRWNIPEPEGGIPIAPSQIDVVFVPLLAFDEQGHRIGYGKDFLKPNPNLRKFLAPTFPWIIALRQINYIALKIRELGSILLFLTKLSPL